jgi:hypothetical protein
VKLRRWYEDARCALGLHRLKAWEPSTSEHAVPMDPRSRPAAGAHRRCDWCGARWEGAYDGITPTWRRL